MATPNLAAQIEQLAGLKKGGALTAKQFDRLLAKLPDEGVPCRRPQQFPTVILGALVGIVSAIALAYGGWLGKTAIDVNEAVATLELRLKTVEDKVDAIENVQRIIQGQRGARRESQEESRP